MRVGRGLLVAIVSVIGFSAPVRAAEEYFWEAHWRVDSNQRLTKDYRFRAEGQGVRDRLERWRLPGEDWPWTFWEGVLPSLEGSDRRVDRTVEPVRGEVGREGLTARWKFEGLQLNAARRESGQWWFYPPPLEDPALVAAAGAERSKWTYQQREIHVQFVWRVEAPGPRTAVLRQDHTVGAPGFEGRLTLRPLTPEEVPSGSVGWEWVSDLWLRALVLNQRDVARQWTAFSEWARERSDPIVWRAAVPNSTPRERVK